MIGSWKGQTLAQFACVALTAAGLVFAAGARGNAGLIALADTRSSIRIFIPTYVVAGAGQGGEKAPYDMVYNSDWWSQLIVSLKKGGTK